jgi:hypothetical protein
MAARLSSRLLEDLHAGFVAVDHRTVQQLLAQQVEQRLQVLAALDHPARQGLPRQVDAVAGQDLFEAVQRQAVDVLDGQQHRQHAGTGQALLDQLGWFVGSDRWALAALAGVDLADVADHADLHRHDLELLADLFAADVLAAAAFAGQFVLGQFVDHLDARQLRRQRLALATTLAGGSNGLFGSVAIQVVGAGLGQVFGFVEQRQLRRRGILLPPSVPDRADRVHDVTGG